MQVLQAANTGITSLQKLVDTAKSIANQVLQTTVGYSSKSTATSAIALGGNAANLVEGTVIKSGDVLAIAATGGGTGDQHHFGASESLDQLNAALAATTCRQHRQLQQARDHHDERRSFVPRWRDHLYQHRRRYHNVRRVAAPVADATSQAIRSNLVGQYNNIIAQITTTAQDSSFNGINLLNGDNLKLYLQRDRQVHAQHHRRHLQCDRPGLEYAGCRYGLQGQQLGEQE